MNEFKEENMIYFAKTRPDALIPTKEEENAGYDLFAAFDEDYIIVRPFKTSLIPTGIAWACSPKFYMQIEERSSTGTKGIKKSSGVVDSGYRGEIKVAIFNANDKPLVFSPYQESYVKEKIMANEKDIDVNDIIFYTTSKAIAQGIIHRVEEMKTKEISLQALKQIPSKRGEKGWGSTNMQDNIKKIEEFVQNIKKNN